MDGLEVLSRLRRNEIQTPILILTARDAISDRIEGLDRGADDYLAKPFHPRELESRARALLRRGLGPPHPALPPGALRPHRPTRTVPTHCPPTDPPPPPPPPPAPPPHPPPAP